MSWPPAVKCIPLTLLRHVHTHEIGHTCVTCGAGFEIMAELREHRKRSHFGSSGLPVANPGLNERHFGTCLSIKQTAHNIVTVVVSDAANSTNFSARVDLTGPYGIQFRERQPVSFRVSFGYTIPDYYAWDVQPAYDWP